MDDAIAKAAEAHAASVAAAEADPCGNCTNNDGRSMRILNRNLSSTVPTLPIAEPETWFFDLYGTRVMFDSNSLCLAQIGETLYNELKDLGDPDTSKDRAETVRHAFRGLFMSRNKPQFRLPRAVSVRRVVLNVTHACNLACKYCFAAEHADVVPMTMQTAKLAINMIEQKGAPLDVAFFGGEPLLAWDLVRSVMEYVYTIAHIRKVPSKFHITTNGVLLDEEKLRFLKDRPCSLLISLDGPKEIHDAARPMKNGQSSFDAVMNTLQTAAELGMSKRIMARATFTMDDPRLVERLEFFSTLQDAGLIAGAAVEPAILSEGCATRSAGVMDKDVIRREYHAAAEWFVSRLKAGNPARFFDYRKILERLLDAKHYGTECGGGNGYVTAAPDGTIHACHREGTPIGHVDYGIDEDSRAEWSDNRIYCHPGCMNCWARYVCGGGCRQARLELGGDVFNLCLIRQTMIRECMWILTQVDRAAIASEIPVRKNNTPRRGRPARRPQRQSNPCALGCEVGTESTCDCETSCQAHCELNAETDDHKPEIMWIRCGEADAEQFRCRMRTGSIGLEGPWGVWTDGKPQKKEGWDYEYRRRDRE